MRNFIVCLFLIIVASIPAKAYVPLGQQWPVGSIIKYYVNTNSNRLTSEQTLNAIQLAADEWNKLGLAFRLEYGGPSSATAMTQNGRSDIFFTDVAPADGLCCRTRNFSLKIGFIDESDIMLSQNPRIFFGEDEICDSGTYVRQVMTHEFGHLLGLNHSSVPTATMYPYTSYCARDWTSLDPDDIEGITSLYGASTPPPPPDPDPTTPTLTVTTSKVKGYKIATIRWANFTSTYVDIYRDYTLIRKSTANDGSEIDNLNTKGGGYNTYKVCDTGTNTCVSTVAQW